MKVVILAGGYGTRISEESFIKPKPMVEIGGKPILWHIMKHYSEYGFNDFIICMGYKANCIRDYFANYYLYNSDVTFDCVKNKINILNNVSEPWKVTLVDTGLDTMTGGRVKRIQKYIGNEPFMLTYGDGVSDVNLTKLLKFHKSSNKIATITVTKFFERFGIVSLDKRNNVTYFAEKSKKDSDYINSGFMVLSPKVFKYIKNDSTIFEKEAIQDLIKDKQLNAYVHEGFWQCMDTLRDKIKLEELWNKGKAPWAIWQNKR